MASPNSAPNLIDQPYHSGVQKLAGSFFEKRSGSCITLKFLSCSGAVQPTRDLLKQLIYTVPGQFFLFGTFHPQLALQTPAVTRSRLPLNTADSTHACQANTCSSNNLLNQDSLVVNILEPP